MARGGKSWKEEVRVFLDPPTLRVIDELIRKGEYTSRSEAIRDIVRRYIEIKGLK